MSRKSFLPAALSGLALAVVANPVLADALTGQTVKQETNWTAIAMFVAFVLLTLGITYWAAKNTRSAAHFYSAGGGITGFQNGLAIAGDYMSAASFLGISGLVYTIGYDGLIYSVGFLVGWPIVTVPDRGAPAQPRQVHLRRRRLVPLRSRRRSACSPPAARWSWSPST